ncbi:MAG: histidine phosphatase family protein [Pseudomonadota bacterium]
MSVGGLTFLRHPSVSVPQGLCYGRLEVGLAAEAPDQIAACLAALPRVSQVVASPMRRCRDLAQAVADRDGTTVQYDPRLMEYDFGAWEGRFWADIPRAQSEPWTQAIVDARPPGGESFLDLIARVRAALEEMPQGAVVVAHAGPIRAARMILTGDSFDTVFAERVPHATPIVMQRAAA